MRLSHGKPLITEGYGVDRSALPPFEEGRLDPRAWFGEPEHALEIEIGAGKGTLLVDLAALRPEVNFLGIEKAGEFYRYAADRVRRRGLRNVRVLHVDAAEFLRFWCADGVATAVHVYFSDPWPKKRHHKRRVIQDRTLIEIHRVLTRGGELHLVTDHADLQAWYEDHAARHAHLFERRPFQPPPSAARGELVGSNYERKLALEGRPFYGMRLAKRVDA